MRTWKNIGAVGREETLFFIALHIYIADTFLEMSLYDYMWDRLILQAIKYSMMLFLALKWILYEKYDLKKTLMWIAVLGCAVLSVLVGRYTSLLLAVSLAVSGEGIPFRKMVRHLLFGEIFWTAVIMLSCFVGILQDYTFPHAQAFEGAIAHSFGFKYYSLWGNLVLAFVMMWAFLRGKRVTWAEILLGFVLNYGLYRLHTTNLPYYICTASLIAVIIISKFGFQFRGRFWKYAGILAPWLLFAATALIFILHQRGIFTIDRSKHYTLWSRFNYTQQAIDKYGIHLFGSDIKMLGNTKLMYGQAESSFYIDSGYMYILLAYGICMAVILLFMYSVIMRYISLKQESFLYAWVIVYLVMDIINNYTIDIYNIPVILLFASAFALLPRGTALNLRRRAVKKRHDRYSIEQS
ncbi:MAG: hypothetical protein Q4B15_01735 [Lachnospiraceae bacterium]|nr:hypothetical protein [Lachnospiraceae bacterium]